MLASWQSKLGEMIAMPETRSSGEAIRSGTMWFLAGSLSNQLVQLAFGIVLVRLLVRAEFGMLVPIQIFIGLVGFLAGGAMSTNIAA